jgi:hypothetical protein
MGNRLSSIFTFSTAKFIEKAKKVHHSKYDYSKVVYKNIRSKVIIICKTHGEFLQIAHHHLRGSGCTLCAGRRNENLTRDYLKQLFPSTDIKPKTFNVPIYNELGDKIRNKFIVDFCFTVNEKNYAVEYNGAQHYQPISFGQRSQKNVKERFIAQQQRDKFLRKYCKENNINLIEIDGRKYTGIGIRSFLTESLLTSGGLATC